MKYYTFIIIGLLVFSACKSRKAKSVVKETKTTETSTKSEPAVDKTMPSFLQERINKASKTNAISVSKFLMNGTTYYAYNGCTGCPDNMTQIYDASGKNVANCGGIAGFRGEFCAQLEKAEVIYKQKGGKEMED